MLVDTNTRLPDDLLQFDVCIIGSGPAGITLAREISRSGLCVCLLESGGNKPAEDTQKLNAGAVESPHGYREQTLRDGRRRQFGGTANLWNHAVRGESTRHIRYVPLDEIDFEQRDWVPESGWPFSRREIQAFYERAQEICGIGKFGYEAGACEAGTKNSRLWQTQKIESVVSQFGASRIFLEHYRRELVRHERVTVILHAALLQLQMDPLSRSITSAQAGTLDGRKFQVRAQAFVLAAGGLENARILLLQDALQPGGLGNQHDMVGRCFMDHPAITLGALIPSSGTIFAQAGLYDQHDVGGQAIMYQLHIRPDVMRREKMLNLSAVLIPHFKNLRTNSRAVLHQLLVRTPRFLWRYLSAEYRYSHQNDGEPPQPLRRRLLEQYYSEGLCGWSRLRWLERRFAEFRVRCLVEQSPDQSNRIMLQQQTDALGQRKIKVLWRWNELDLRSIRQAQQIFREELAAAGIGTFIPEEETAGSEPRRFNSSHHFLGTTRMHDDPRNGVVDADCRVHDVPNLFIAGSSVFPTGGFANPTLTIVALAVRLATHLQSELLSTPQIRANQITEQAAKLKVRAMGQVAEPPKSKVPAWLGPGSIWSIRSTAPNESEVSSEAAPETNELARKNHPRGVATSSSRAGKPEDSAAWAMQARRHKVIDHSPTKALAARVRPDRSYEMRNAVVYVIDEKGYELARHAAASFILTQFNFQDMHVFCHKFMPSRKDRLINVGEENGVRVHIEPIDDPQIEKLDCIGHITHTAHLKLKSVEMISHAYDRVLYVDYDLLFFEQIFLEKIDLEGFPIGAVYDIAVSSGMTDADFIQNCLKNNRSPHHFNSGLMLFDCSQWDYKSKEKYMQLLDEHQVKCDYMKKCLQNDQCIINRLFENNWKRLPLAFNMQASAKFTGKWAHASVRHYQGTRKFLPVRPWRNDSRDIRLIRRIRKALGYNDPWRFPLGILFRLNGRRNMVKADRSSKAIADVELMFSQPMPDREVAGSC
jgi:choline dehydrogenase-like flavoprotein/lipopolysaccharide biosynthesis glycosyltransferase